MTKVIMENNSLNEIPMLSMYPEGAEKLPLVFYIHGYDSNKEQALDFGYMLAKEGFYFVSFDCQAHGTRTDKTNKFSKVYPPELDWILMFTCTKLLNKQVKMFKG